MNCDHLLVRRDGILCTRCRVVEPFGLGGDLGLSMPKVLEACNLAMTRHQVCEPKR